MASLPGVISVGTSQEQAVDNGENTRRRSSIFAWSAGRTLDRVTNRSDDM